MGPGSMWNTAVGGKKTLPWSPPMPFWPLKSSTASKEKLARTAGEPIRYDGLLARPGLIEELGRLLVVRIEKQTRLEFLSRLVKSPRFSQSDPEVQTSLG